MSYILQDQTGATWALSVNATDNSLQIVPAPNNTPSAGSANSLTTTGLDLINAAMTEIGALAGGESAALVDAAWCLQKLQRVIDRWNARAPMVYNVNFSRWTIPINTAPITIGPGANLDVIQRPVDIVGVSLILTTPGATEVEFPLNNRDQDWWAGLSLKKLTSTLPTDFYYSPDWPNGSLYLWPIPNTVNDIRVQTRAIIAEITSYSQSFTMPPGYWDLIIYDLAVSIAPSFDRPVSPDLRESLRQAIKAVQTNNIKSPRLMSDAPTEGGSNNSRPGFNFLTGLGN